MPIMGLKLPSATLRPRAVINLALWLLSCLVPSFIVDLINADGGRRPRKLHPTSYLDGLRGLAACAVFAFHYTDYNHKSFLPHYGGNGDAGSSLIQLPFLRLIYSGAPMVHVFFVISGFALSCRPLQALYARPAISTAPSSSSSSSAAPTSAGVAKSLAILSSSALRRPIRLLVPPLAVTFAVAVLIQLDLLHGFMKPKDTLAEALYEWAHDALKNLAWPWSFDAGSLRSRYDPHLWTIPIELSHSLFLFLVLFAVTPLRSARARRLAFLLIMAYSLVTARWAAFEFMGGALLADHYCAQHARESDDDAAAAGHDGDGLSSESPLLPLPLLSSLPIGGNFSVGNVPVAKYLPAAKVAGRYAVLVFSLFILSYPPRRDDMTPAYLWLEQFTLSSFVKEKSDLPSRFWLALAAFGTVWSIGRTPAIRRFLSSPVPQYAGRISFCFYLMQHAVLNLFQHHTLGATARPASNKNPAEPAWGVRGTFGNTTPVERTMTWFAGLAILGTILVIVSDLGTRALDAPAVKLARRVEGYLCHRDEPRRSADQEK